MNSLLTHLDATAPAVLFNVALLVIFYLVARILNARQTVALAFAFVPILFGFAYLGSVAPY